MSDVKLDIDPVTLAFDLSGLEFNDLTRDNTFQTAVIISLFSDRRANREEVDNQSASLRGWWGDAIDPLVENNILGSKLWLLEREKTSDETLSRAREYCLEALQWFVDEDIVQAVDVETSYLETTGAKQTMRIVITFTKPDGNKINFNFDQNWRAQINAL